MGLKEVQEDLKKQIAEALEREAGELASVGVDQGEEPTVEPTKEEPDKEEETVKETEASEKQEAKEEEKPDNAAMARARREKKAAERLAQQREDENAALREELATLKKAPKAEEPIKEREDIPDVMVDIVERHQREQAAQELSGIEADFSRSNPAYNDISAQYANAIAQSIRIQNPRLSASQIAETAADIILRKAGTFAKNGLNPAEELYHEALELGFKARPATEQQDKPKAEEKKAPDMAKVAANRARNAGTAAAPGASGEGQMTANTLMGLSTREFLKVPKAERDKIMARAR